MNKKSVAVIFGGRSGEHEVSLVSAQSVMQELDPDRYIVVPVGIDKEGRWWTGDDAMRFLRRGAGTPRRCMFPPEPGSILLLEEASGAWIASHVDLAFPVIHGSNGEDGTLQGLFELAEIPYVGAGVAASAVAMDKVLQKRLHREAGLPVVPFLSFSSRDIAVRAEQIASGIAAQLGLPVFVKPPNLGSSVGISKAATQEELAEALRHAARFDRKVLAEIAVPQAREIEVAVLGNEDPVASVPGEVVPSNEFYDYDAKYVDGASSLLIPADLPQGMEERIRRLAVEAFRALDCEGMARVDFLLARESGELYINEINTIPGFTSISMYPKLFEAVGIPYRDLLDRLIDLALRRHAERQALTRSYTPRAEWFRDE
ncbi:MAG: D-alanine--D-alanine ligase [Bacteroidetes bacterium]|nr:D-alanine--D-alanine ligase [Bacteroidota bacterium]